MLELFLVKLQEKFLVELLEELSVKFPGRSLQKFSVELLVEFPLDLQFAVELRRVWPKQLLEDLLVEQLREFIGEIYCRIPRGIPGGTTRRFLGETSNMFPAGTSREFSS